MFIKWWGRLDKREGMDGKLEKVERKGEVSLE